MPSLYYFSTIKVRTGRSVVNTKILSRIYADNEEQRKLKMIVMIRINTSTVRSHLKQIIPTHNSCKAVATNFSVAWFGITPSQFCPTSCLNLACMLCLVLDKLAHKQ